MDLLSYRQMAAAGADRAEIARLAGCDWRTALGVPLAERRRRRAQPAGRRSRSCSTRSSTRSTPSCAPSRAQIRATTIDERLTSDHGYGGS